MAKSSSLIVEEILEGDRPRKREERKV